MSREEMLQNVLIMRESADLLIAFKVTHPTLFPGDNKLWAKDIAEMAHIIEQYDGLIRHLLEINLKLTDMHTEITNRLGGVVPPKDA